MAWTGETDLGTPAPAGDALPLVTLSIDGRRVSVAAGTSVMRAAGDPQAVRDRQREELRFVPPVSGRNRRPRATPASCTTPVEEGMVVRTQTDRSRNCGAG
jgi:formate dehydrogenase major subunit